MQNYKFEMGREKNTCFAFIPCNFKIFRFIRCSGTKALETSSSKYVLEGSYVIG